MGYAQAGSDSNKYNFKKGFSNNINDPQTGAPYAPSIGPGPGVYLMLATTMSDKKPTNDGTINLTSINTNTFIYLLVVSASPNVDTTNYKDYGVVITSLYGHDTTAGFNLTQINPKATRMDNTNVYMIIPNTDENMYHMWYVKVF
jgi:hypothetical protein